MNGWAEWAVVAAFIYFQWKAGLAEFRIKKLEERLAHAESDLNWKALGFENRLKEIEGKLKPDQ
jgi:hypothetical protein